MSFSFIPVALAAQEGAQSSAQAASTFSSIFLLAGFMLIFYFMIWRPQSKKAKEHQKIINSLNNGDEVITNSGILGRITKLSNQFVVVEVAEQVEIILQKSAIVAVVPKGTIESV